MKVVVAVVDDPQMMLNVSDWAEPDALTYIEAFQIEP